MKKVLSMVIILVVLTVFTYAETKIGIVNSQLVLKNSVGGKAFMTELSALDKKMTTQMQNMAKDLKKLEKELASPALNATSREKKAEILRNKQTAAKRFYEDSKRKFTAKQQKGMQKITKQIMPIIQNVGKSKGFTVIMEIQAVAYYDKAIDISADVIKAYDAVYKKKK